jgi:hypothetical protein
MTKSTITREQLEEWVTQFEEDGGCDATDRQLEALIRQSLAAMNGEPDCKERKLFCSTDTARMRKAITVSAGTDVAQPYRHAQPALVVEREPIAWLNDAYLARGVVDGEAGSEDAGPGYIPVYREAGPQPAPVVPGKWIPVSERMPEDRISVILWDAEIGEVTSGHYSHKTQTFYHCGDAIENEITHWMPPPCAPQEVK